MLAILGGENVPSNARGVGAGAEVPAIPHLVETLGQLFDHVRRLGLHVMAEMA